MPCDECRKLNLFHSAAEFRVWRYANPDGEPPMGLMRPYRLSKRLRRARAEVANIRTLIEEHIASCDKCKNVIASVIEVEPT